MAEDERYFVAICVECRSPQPDKYMESTPFANPPCKYCGGYVDVALVANQDELDLFLERRQNRPT